MENILLKKIMRLREEEMKNVRDEIVKGITVELDNILGRKLEYNEYSTMVKERVENSERVNRQLNDIIESERRQMRDMKSNLVDMLLENKKLKKEIEALKNTNKELEEKLESEQSKHILTSKVLDKVEEEREGLRIRYEEFRQNAYNYVKMIHEIKSDEPVCLSEIKYLQLVPIPHLKDSKDFDIFGSHRIALIDSNGTGELFEYDIRFSREESKQVRDGEIYKSVKEEVLKVEKEFKDYLLDNFSVMDICNEVMEHVLDGRLTMGNIEIYVLYKYATEDCPNKASEYGFRRIFGEMPHGVFGFPAYTLNNGDYSTSLDFDDGTM